MTGKPEVKSRPNSQLRGREVGIWEVIAGQLLKPGLSTSLRRPRRSIERLRNLRLTMPMHTMSWERFLPQPVAWMTACGNAKSLKHSIPTESISLRFSK